MRIPHKASYPEILEPYADPFTFLQHPFQNSMFASMSGHSKSWEKLDSPFLGRQIPTDWCYP